MKNPDRVISCLPKLTLISGFLNLLAINTHRSSEAWVTLPVIMVVGPCVALANNFPNAFCMPKANTMIITSPYITVLDSSTGSRIANKPAIASSRASTKRTVFFFCEREVNHPPAMTAATNTGKVANLIQAEVSPPLIS
ncbi:hypothetical protein D3C80_543250 [compost metagenome]